MRLPKITGLVEGAANSLPNHAFRIASVALTLRSGVRSYHQLTTPYSDTDLEAFIARPDGQVVIFTDGVEWQRFNQEALRQAVGPYSKTITLSGYRQVTNSTPTTYPVGRVDCFDVTNDLSGRLTLPMPPFMIDAEAGDNILFEATTYRIDIITVNLSVVSQTFTYSLEEL